MLLALTLCFLASLSGFVLGHPTSVARNGVTYSHPLHDGKPAKIPSQLTLISVDKRQPSPFGTLILSSSSDSSIILNDSYRARTSHANSPVCVNAGPAVRSNIYFWILLVRPGLFQ